jgi:hypothetical protein
VDKVKEELVGYLEKYWTENKAKGLMAQSLFRKEVRSGIYSEYRRKFFGGCWVLAPKRRDFFKFRFCFFVHPSVLGNVPDDDLEPEAVTGEAEGLKLRMVAGFLTRAGMGVIYMIPVGESPLPPENIQWFLYRYDDKKEILRRIDAAAFFSRWEGMGRPGYGKAWSARLKQDYLALEEGELTSLLLNEAFYTSFLKGYLKKSISDPYDVDGFLLSYSTRTVLPFEIKEKFPAGSGDSAFFGIDAGRVLMLLRLCLPNDANAFYVIREVSEADRRFIDWKFMPISEIIVSASWNLQRGGRGMGGQETQTIRLPYHGFRRLEPSILSDSSLDEVGNLPRGVKKLAEEFKKMLEEE